MYNVVGAMFAEESEARQAMGALIENPTFNGTTILQMSLVKRKNGELKLCDNFASDTLESGGTVKGGLLGGLIGLLGGPLGALLGGAAGTLLGGAADSSNKDKSKSLIEQTAQRLEEGDLALIMVVNEDEEAVLDRQLLKYNVYIARFDADAIAKEVEAAEKRERELEEAREENA